MAPPNLKDDEAHQRLLEQLDIARTARPFRNPHWKPSARRNKNVKQVLSETSRKEASAIATQNNSGASTPFPTTQPMVTTDGTQTPVPNSAPAASTPVGAAAKPPNIAQAAQNLSTLVLEKNFRSAYPTGPAVTFTNIESAPSLHPGHHKHYCDVTGLPAPYTDPKTRLRYHDKEVFGVVRTLGQGVAETYLEARGAHTVLK